MPPAQRLRDGFAAGRAKQDAQFLAAARAQQAKLESEARAAKETERIASLVAKKSELSGDPFIAFLVGSRRRIGTRLPPRPSGGTQLPCARRRCRPERSRRCWAARQRNWIAGMRTVVSLIFTDAFCNSSGRHRTGSGVRLKLRRLTRMVRSAGNRIEPAKYLGAADCGWYKSEASDAGRSNAAPHAANKVEILLDFMPGCRDAAADRQPCAGIPIAFTGLG